MKRRIKLYRPSNGTEGEIFMSRFCYRCSKDSEKRPCGIIGLTMAFDEKDADYPREWRYVDGKPTCTAFVDRKDVEPRIRVRRLSTLQQSLFS